MLLTEQIAQMRRSASRLNGRQRRAILLREVDERSYAEIGATLGISEDAVAQMIARARARLRLEFRRESTPAFGSLPACTARHDALSAYVDGHLPEAARPELEDHLGACAGCRHVLTGYREAGLRLRAGGPLSPLAALLERVAGAFQGAAGHSLGGVATLAGGAVVVAAGAGGMAVAHRVAGQAAPPQVVRATSPATTTDRPRRDGPAPPSPHAWPSAERPAPAVITIVGKPGSTTLSSSPGAGSVPSSTAGSSDKPSTPGAIAPPTLTVSTRDGKTPTLTTPHVTTPHVTTPAVTTPAVTTPAVTTPAVSTPHVSVPSVTTPKVATPVATVPAVTTPPVDVPPVTVPKVKLPAVTVPAVTVPPTVTLPKP
jgi:sigma-70-like protein/putative zinc finger protein